MRALWIALVALAIQAQTPRDPTDVLVHARDQMIERERRLPNYTCVQTVDREYFVRALPEEPPPSCDKISAEARKKSYKLNLNATDRLRLDVKVSGGVEIGSWAGANHFDSRSIVDLVGGPFGTGPFGPLLQDVFINDRAAFQYLGEDSVSNTRVFHYRFQVPVEASHLMVRGGRAGDWIASSYDGELWIDPASFDLRRMSYRSSELSPETNACEVRLTADYSRVRFDSGDFLIPQQSVLYNIMQDTQETQATSRYSSCREYRGEATLSFGDVQSTASAAAAAARPAPQSLPAGLKITLAFTAPIDTDTAAAGDAVLAEVRKPVRDNRSKEVLIPAGATVHGRIVQMQHWLASPAYSIAILLESLDVDGASSPIYARLDRRDELPVVPDSSSGLRVRGAPIVLPPVGRSTSVSTFIFRTSSRRYVVPLNYESNWITTPPPNPAGH